MRPKSPMALPKISMTRILTNKDGSWASERAAPLPVMPTQTPQARLDKPTVKPPQKTE